MRRHEQGRVATGGRTARIDGAVAVDVEPRQAGEVGISCRVGRRMTGRGHAALSDELERLEADLPRIYAAGDRRASRDAGRRHQELKPVVEAYAEWRGVSEDIDDARELLESMSDPAERETWRAELADKEAQLSVLEG